MYKSDLKTGMVVETNNGSKFLVLLDGEDEERSLISLAGGWMDLNRYGENLIYPTDDGWSIKKVYSVGKGIAFALCGVRSMMNGAKLLWEREEAELQTEMTVAEIEKKLGISNLKIVKEK